MSFCYALGQRHIQVCKYFSKPSKDSENSSEKQNKIKKMTMRQILLFLVLRFLMEEIKNNNEFPIISLTLIS